MVTCANFSHYLLRGGPPFPGVVAVLENRALNASIPVIKCLQRSVLLSLHYYAQHTKKQKTKYSTVEQSSSLRLRAAMLWKFPSLAS